LSPTFPVFPRPATETIQETTPDAKHIQNALRYPSRRAPEKSAPALFEDVVIPAASIAVAARPIELPSCDTVLKTPPAGACVLSGKELVMTRLETVKSRSEAIGDRHIAGNAAAQYGHSGESIAKSKGLIALTINETETRIMAGTLLTRKPIAAFVAAPMTTKGKK
jgi:hypothetical protein